MDLLQLFKEMFEGVSVLWDWKILLMYAIGIILIYFAIKKDYEPALLLPIGFGAILVNLPFGVVWEAEGVPGFLQHLFNFGIATELFPILIFIAIGAMIDFSPLFKSPVMIFFGAAAQFGIFITFIAAYFIGSALNIFPDPNELIKHAAAIGIIGAADGPTSIYVANKFARDWIAPISVAAYSYMALVPLIQPPVIKLLTSKKERLIRMEYKDSEVSKTAKIVFPICITMISGILVPSSVPLIGPLMFGNLIRECGVLERLNNSAQNELANLVTLLLGITIGATMKAQNFLKIETVIVLALGLFAFIFDTAGGVLFAKFINLFVKNKFNPMIGAAGISAFPMSARVVQRIAKEEDPTNFILMQSVSANVSGQLGSVMAGGFIIYLVAKLCGVPI